MVGSGVLRSSTLTYSIAFSLLRTQRRGNIFILIMSLMFIAEPFSDCESQLDKTLTVHMIEGLRRQKSKELGPGDLAAGISMWWEGERHSRGRLVSL